MFKLIYIIKHAFILSILPILFFLSDFGTNLNNVSFDLITQFQEYINAPHTLEDNVVVVGIDENSLPSFPEPIALWHPYIKAFLEASASANAKAVGLDIILPERSYDFVKPGLDDGLTKTLLRTNTVMPVILGKTINRDGLPRSIYNRFELAVGESHIGYALFPLDSDGMVRKFSEKLGSDDDLTPTLVGQMLRSVGKNSSEGFIDFNHGGKHRYIPIQDVIEWHKNHDQSKLNDALKGKFVLLGSVLPAEDRIKLPINLASWEINNHYVSGVLLHAQSLRAILADRLVLPIGLWASLGFIFLCTFIWLIEPGKIKTPIILGLALIFLFNLTILLFKRGVLFPLGICSLTLIFSTTARIIYDAIQKVKERALLRKSFAGAVSPALMKEILAGKFNPKLGGERRHLCILFADIRGFTTLSEVNSPEYIIKLLNRYFEGVVGKIHQQNGVVLCFMGDGIMAAFGAPKPLESPELSAFLAAQEMLTFVEQLNTQLSNEGHQTIKIGIGIHAGELIIGHVGSTTRSDYTVIGDVANLASRLEGMTKELGCDVAVSEYVALKLRQFTEIDLGLTEFGIHNIKGRSPERIYGWSK